MVAWRWLAAVFDLAAQLGRSSNDLGASILALHANGFEMDDLRVAIDSGWITVKSHPSSTSEAANDEGVHLDDYVRLTRAGREMISTWFADQSTTLPMIDDHPVYDSNTLRLWWQGKVVREFKKHAPDQTLILATFQEDDWCEQIDSPISGNAVSDPVTRTRNGVAELNRRIVPRTIRFSSVLGGQVIRWKKE